MDMRKNLFYFAMALCVALCNVACSSDDDGDDNGGGGGYTTPKYTEQAAAYTFSEDVENQVKADAGGGKEVVLKSLNFTEDGKVVIGVEADGTLKYVTYDVVINGDVYTVKNGTEVLGTITKETTRNAASWSNLKIDVRITIPNIGPVRFNPAEAVKALEVAKAVGMSNIIGTWKITRMKLALDFEEKRDVSTEVSGGKLVDFLTLAEENNISLTEEEENSLRKEVESFTIDQYGLFTITYNGGGSDAANWKWNGNGKSKLIITLKDSEMGNKFLQNNSTITVDYPGNNKIVMTMTTDLKDDKCKATLIVNLSR